MSELTNNFTALAAVNVNHQTKKKGKGDSGFTYLSWAYALEELLKKDPLASWVFHEPTMFGQTMMVSCTLTAFDKPVYMWLPVMDFSNKAMKDPDAVAVNKAMMRCLVKAIAAHGLGLYIYAGEDLPSEDDVNVNQQSYQPQQVTKAALEAEREQGAINAMKNDPKWSLDRIKQTYALTPDQLTRFEQEASNAA